MPTSLLAGGSRLAGFTAVLLAAPTEKVNAPCTGCESADITCQPTGQAPVPRPGSRPTVVCWGSRPCVVSPLSARCPLGAYTRRLSGLTPTGSSKVTLTVAGALATIAASGGLVDTSVAWAKAAVDVPSTPIALNNTAASRYAARRITARRITVAPSAMGRATAAARALAPGRALRGAGRPGLGHSESITVAGRQREF